MPFKVREKRNRSNEWAFRTIVRDVAPHIHECRQNLPTISQEIAAASLVIDSDQRHAALPFRFALMPLSEGAPALIRANLEQVQSGKRARLVVIGALTDSQLTAINDDRRAHGYPPIIAEVVFIGRHVHQSRIERDGYSVDDVIDQIGSAMEAAAVVLQTPAMTAMENPASRADRYGNAVRDRAIFECSARHPRPELFSVVPKGDRIKPKRPPTE